MTFRLKNILHVVVIILITNFLCFSQKRDSNSKKKGELTVSQLQEAEFYFTEGMKYYMMEDYEKAIPSYQKALETDHPEKIMDTALLKKIYTDLTETEEYKRYTTEQSRDKAKEREIIRLIFTQLMLPNENFISHIEEFFNNWDDDAEMMDQLMLTYIQKPNSIQFDQLM